MKTAFILCAGFGKRLNKLTQKNPKPMLLVDKKPILEYTIEHLSQLGIKNIIINVHYLAEQFISYFQNGKKWNVSIKFIYEKNPLGTAGAVKNIENIIKDNDFLVLYGDIICNEDYLKLYKFHTNKKSVATIIIHKRKISNSIVRINKDDLITEFIERPKKNIENNNWVNSGLYCFNKNIFNYIQKGFSDLPKDIFPKLVENKLIYGYSLNSYRCAIDSEKRYNKVIDDHKKGFF